MSLLQLLRQPAQNRNLLDVLTKLPRLGVGSRVTRKSWEPYGDSYWEVTAVKPKTADGTRGRIWGVLTWRGERQSRTRQINGRAKRLWRWVPTEQEAAQLQPLVQELRQLKRWQKLAAEQQAAGSSSEAAS